MLGLANLLRVEKQITTTGLKRPRATLTVRDLLGTGLLISLYRKDGLNQSYT